MTMPTNSHLTETLSSLRAQGFSDALRFEDGKLHNLKTRKAYSAEDIVQYDEYRFEGMSNPSDMSILFAIRFKDGHKGTLAATYGPQGDAGLIELLKKVQ